MNNPNPNTPLLTAEVAERILKGETHITLDLGLSETSITLQGHSAVFPDGSKVELKNLRRILKNPDTVFMLLDSKPQPVALSDGHHYKLVPTTGAPTLEIDGIRMHRTKETTPEADAKDKIKALRIRKGQILEIGTGLGYTAQAALDAGANQIISIEISPEVLKIARMNPWSHRIFTDKRIHTILGDAYDITGSLRPGLFNYIIHDPPRFSLAGHLYSTSLYAELLRTLKNGGRLLHYTGEPGSRYRGRNLREGVSNRLRQAGFVKVIYHQAIKALTCTKPSAP